MDSYFDTALGKQALEITLLPEYERLVPRNVPPAAASCVV